jgi:hypothetical protein
VGLGTLRCPQDETKRLNGLVKLNVSFKDTPA